ncbi:hypothetical protein D3C80_998830 [compost metagenome]
MDFPDCFNWVDSLVFQGKFIFDSIARFDLLLVYDGRIKCLELDLFWSLVADRIGDLF